MLRLSLQPGSRLGAYDIVAKLGEGGMGEVYRARDAKLGREVAIKVLPPAFARHPDRLARFEREARALAALNHPNIAQVYGLDEGPESRDGRNGSDGLPVPFLVMELLEGRSLSNLLADGALPAKKAVDYAAQIARGLAAAHDRSIIHRDLKPDNIYVLPDGRVKILDFGLARQAEPEGPAAHAATEPGTLVTRVRVTDPGTVMGTVGYMAPEQVRAEPTDARSDLFSLGVVLYEMVAGRRAFQKETGAETMTAILKEDPPDISLLRTDISPALDRIVRHCLEKNPIERFQTARDVAFALDSLSPSSSGSVAAATAAPVTGARNATLERIAWASTVVVLGGIAAWLATRGPAPYAVPTPEAYRGSVVLPERVGLTQLYQPARRLTISPDGSRAVFIGGPRDEPGGRNRLWVVTLADAVVQELDGTESAQGPFFSADSRQVLFTNADQGSLNRISVAGGPVTKVQSQVGAGASAHDGTVVIADQSKVLRRFTGEEPPADVFPPEAGVSYYYPSFLAGGRDIIFLRARTEGASREGSGVFVRSLDSGEEFRLFEGLQPLNVVHANGHMVFAIGSALYAQRYDEKARQLQGERVRLADDVLSTPTGGAAFAASQVGSLVYAPQASQQRSRLVRMSRDGRTLGTIGDAADYSNVVISPDDSRLVVSVMDSDRLTRDIYIVDIARGVRQRLTFDSGDERSAVWTADGQRVIFFKDRDLYMRSADFTGGDEAVQTDGASKDPLQVSPDGRTLLFRRTGAGNDLWLMPLEGSRTATAIASSRFDENYAAFSPDGRSIVYGSTESGRMEVYVVAIDGSGGKTLVSNAGGVFPRWRRDGKEIVYLASDDTLMSVTVSVTANGHRFGLPTPLFRIDPQPGPGAPFDLTADGQQFIVNAATPSHVPPSLTLIVNWPSLVKR